MMNRTENSTSNSLLPSVQGVTPNAFSISQDPNCEKPLNAYVAASYINSEIFGLGIPETSSKAGDFGFDDDDHMIKFYAAVKSKPHERKDFNYIVRCFEQTRSPKNVGLDNAGTTKFKNALDPKFRRKLVTSFAGDVLAVIIFVASALATFLMSTQSYFLAFICIGIIAFRANDPNLRYLLAVAIVACTAVSTAFAIDVSFSLCNTIMPNGYQQYYGYSLIDVEIGDARILDLSMDDFFIENGLAHVQVATADGGYHILQLDVRTTCCTDYSGTYTYAIQFPGLDGSTMAYEHKAHVCKEPTVETAIVAASEAVHAEWSKVPKLKDTLVPMIIIFALLMFLRMGFKYALVTALVSTYLVKYVNAEVFTELSSEFDVGVNGVDATGHFIIGSLVNVRNSTHHAIYRIVSDAFVQPYATAGAVINDDPEHLAQTVVHHTSCTASSYEPVCVVDESTGCDSFSAVVYTGGLLDTHARCAIRGEKHIMCETKYRTTYADYRKYAYFYEHDKTTPTMSARLEFVAGQDVFHAQLSVIDLTDGAPQNIMLKHEGDRMVAYAHIRPDYSHGCYTTRPLAKLEHITAHCMNTAIEQISWAMCATKFAYNSVGNIATEADRMADNEYDYQCVDNVCTLSSLITPYATVGRLKIIGTDLEVPKANATCVKVEQNYAWKGLVGYMQMTLTCDSDNIPAPTIASGSITNIETLANNTVVLTMRCGACKDVTVKFGASTVKFTGVVVDPHYVYNIVRDTVIDAFVSNFGHITNPFDNLHVNASRLLGGFMLYAKIAVLLLLMGITAYYSMFLGPQVMLVSTAIVAVTVAIALFAMPW